MATNSPTLKDMSCVLDHSTGEAAAQWSLRCLPMDEAQSLSEIIAL